MDKAKALVEKRNALVEETKALVDTAENETRALDESETNRFQEIKKEISSIDSTLKASDEARAYEMREAGKKTTDEDETRAMDERFLAYVRGETRALDIGQNGGVIPAHIANRIIETVKELSTIYSKVTIFNVGGDLIFPVWQESYTDESDKVHRINAAYVDDMQELLDDSSKFTTVKLENFIIGVLAKISKSLMNRSDLDLLPFLIRKVAESLVEFLEHELVVGTTGKMQGAVSTPNVIETAAAAAITADELIDLQMAVPEVFQGKSEWLLHKDTLKRIRKLKDGDGNYLLNRDLTTAFGWTLLGRPVSITESMPKVAAGAKVVVYGDLSGLYLKFAQGIELQLLTEKYATQHALGIVGYVECDSKIVEPQKLAALKMKAS